jgi:8-hydroxy-5-deazaflavin:NADPH oxidoreductase
MQIGILGAGRMGTAFAKRLGPAGHTVRIAARHAEHAQKAAAEAGPSVEAVAVQDVDSGSDLLIVAVPYAPAVPTLRAVGNLAGKTIVDITNPLAPDMSGLTIGFMTSAAEEIQKAMPSAHVVKAFNTIFARILASPGTGATTAQVFYVGNDPGAKERVRALIETLGFAPVDAGPLANARLIEPLAMLNIYLGHVAGLGTTVAPSWVPVA